MTQDSTGKGARNRNRWVLYYDGDCRLCTGVAHWLRRIDFLDRITWTPYQSLEKLPPGLSWNDFDRSAYLDTGRVHLYEGFYAFRILTLRLVPLLPLAPILWLPGMNRVGEAAYRWVAKNRHRFPGFVIRSKAGGRVDVGLPRQSLSGRPPEEESSSPGPAGDRPRIPGPH